MYKVRRHKLLSRLMLKLIELMPAGHTTTCLLPPSSVDNTIKAHQDELALLLLYRMVRSCGLLAECMRRTALVAPP